MKQYKGIYGYWDVEKSVVAYVGKDSNMWEEKRRRDHMFPSTYDAQPFNRILQNNPERYQYYEICQLPMDATNDELNHYEKHYIKLLKPVHNYTPGGDGRSGYKHTDEAKAKMSAALKGRKFSDEHKAKIGEARKGKYCGKNSPNYKHDLDNKELYESYLELGSYPKVAEKFNCGYGTVYKRINKYALDNNLKDNIDKITSSHKRTDITDKELYEAYLELGSYPKVAKKFNYGYGRVHKRITTYIAENGLENEVKKVQTPYQYRQDLDDKELYETYVREGSYKKVANLFNCNASTVSRRIKKYKESLQ